MRGSLTSVAIIVQLLASSVKSSLNLSLCECGVQGQRELEQIDVARRCGDCPKLELAVEYLVLPTWVGTLVTTGCSQLGTKIEIFRNPHDYANKQLCKHRLSTMFHKP